VGDNPLIRPDPGLYIWTIVTFLALVTLLARFAWRPLLQALDRRQAQIKQSLDDAHQAKLELERLQQESAQIIRQARVEAESIVANSRAYAEKLKDEIKAKARADAEVIVQNAERQIQTETRRALEQIRVEAADLSVMIASKLIQRNLTKEDNARLIEQALEQVESRLQGA
jgi:F-type H+-transporting ATPase subunit b